MFANLELDPLKRPYCEGSARRRMCGKGQEALKAGYSTSPHDLEEETMKEKSWSRILKVLLPFSVLMFQATLVFAEANVESDLDSFLRGIGDFLIRTVGPGVLVIGIAVAGVSMALGDERGMQRGALAAGGGALIMLARAVLDFIQSITHF